MILSYFSSLRLQLIYRLDADIPSIFSPKCLTLWKVPYYCDWGQNCSSSQYIQYSSCYLKHYHHLLHTVAKKTLKSPMVTKGCCSWAALVMASYSFTLSLSSTDAYITPRTHGFDTLSLILPRVSCCSTWMNYKGAIFALHHKNNSTRYLSLTYNPITVTYIPITD